MTDQKIERSDGCGFGQQQVLANSIENFIQHDKKVLAAARNLQSIKTLLSLELSQRRKSASMFSSSEPRAGRGDSRPAETAAETTCVCARPSNPPEQSRRLASKAWPLIWPSKPLITFWTSLRRDIARWPAGAQTWTQTWTLPPDRRVQVVKVLSAPKSQVS